MNSEVLSLKDAEEQLAKYDLIIQTTLIGMFPNVDSSPISVEQFETNCLLSDIIYNPLETKFLREAKLKGARIQNGIRMFVYQGALHLKNGPEYSLIPKE